MTISRVLREARPVRQEWDRLMVVGTDRQDEREFFRARITDAIFRA